MKGRKKMSKSKGASKSIYEKKEIAVAYIRVASRQQGYGLSLPAQESLMRDYAVGKNFDLVRIFSDTASAVNKTRTGFGNILDYLRKHPECKNLLVERKRDGLYRNLTDLVKLGEIHNLVIHQVKK